MKQIAYKKGMMGKTPIRLMAILVTGVALMGCSPRVTTSIFETYPVLPVDSVEVFEEGDPVPISAKVIGKVQVRDRGTTTKCNYDYVLQLAKERTAEIGGNGLYLTEHRLPNARSTCHQVWGNMLYLTDHEMGDTPTMAQQETFGAEVFYRERRNISSDIIMVSVGPSLITSKVVSPRGNESRKGGVDCLLEFEHVNGKGIGFGLNVKYNKTTFDDYGYLQLYYMGPSFVYNYVTSMNWRWDLAVGIGYAMYKDGAGKGNNSFYGMQTQSGIGFMSKIGIDYLLSDRLGIGVEVNNVSHNFSKPEGFQLGKNEHYGFHTLSLTAGLRFYF